MSAWSPVRRLLRISNAAPLVAGCASTPDTPTAQPPPPVAAPATASHKALVPGLPVVGVLLYDKVLGTEVSAPIDVFAKHTEDGKQLFNVITIAESFAPVTSEEGLRMLPDRTFDDVPDLDVLIIPSAYDMASLVANDALVRFIREQDGHTDYTASNCAGAQLIGEAGIADGKKIVTWIGGGEELKNKYPNLLVQDDATTTFVADGKFYSSNGNLATYVASLELLQVMTTKEHRAFIESYLYLERLKEWPRTKQ